jgi:hypothetical protein
MDEGILADRDAAGTADPVLLDRRLDADGAITAGGTVSGPGRLRSSWLADGCGARPPTLDPIAELDQRQFAARDLLGQAPTTPRVLDLEQLVGMRDTDTSALISSGASARRSRFST